MFILLLIIFLFVICFLVPLHFGKFDKPQYNEIELAETEEQKEINKQERIETLDNALIKYNRLLETLEREYQKETNDKKRAVILSKQINTLEKLNRTLEKREKLE